MRTVSASELKRRCSALLDDLDPEGIVITKRGKPVARLLPIERTSAVLMGCLRGRIKIKGDIFSTGVTWAADSGS